MMIVLASTSSIRAKLLLAAGIPFAIEKPRVDESALRIANPDWAERDVAGKLAEAKALEVSSRMLEKLVIGADQTLMFGGRIFGKPADMTEARAHLERLRGKTHELHTAVCCARFGHVVWKHADAAQLTMRDYSDSFLDSYLAEAGDGCLTSVGAYKLEERGIQLFERISGNHHTVLGLPLLPLLSFLRGEGLIAT